MSEAFTSTTNCWAGSGWESTRAVVNSTLTCEKVALALSVQVKGRSIKVSSVSGAATLL